VHSKYYLTPGGQKRHPLAFSPFLGGRRICIGKTFGEIVAKLVVPGFLARLDFEFADPTQEKPLLNVDMIEQPIVMMKISQAKHF
jgi:cytochrome P450